jgi:hypothetical protein
LAASLAKLTGASHAKDIVLDLYAGADFIGGLMSKWLPS